MYALQIQQLCKTYPNGVEALKSIDLNVKSGDFFALLGANGAGKSTAIGLISSLLVKTSGQIAIHNYDLDHQPQQAKACLGLVPQEINLNIFETCEHTLLNQAGYYGLSRNKIAPHTKLLLNELGLWEKRHEKVRQLSGGMKRRLMIARALIHQPKLLILDEPTAGVDIEIRRNIWDFLVRTNQQGTTIILTTHYLEEAEQLCKNIAIIDKGSIIENTTMKSLLQSLNHQTFIFNTMDSMDSLPELTPFFGLKLDSHTFELRIENKWSLNDVFELFNQKGIRIHSLRNKTNRLEELFLDRIGHEN
ncbi:ABC transporter ATP-binding protein [bacterium]|nr:ABC transporter ATP-binding protein [bacterium]